MVKKIFDSSVLQQQINYAINKNNFSIIKKIIFGLMGGIFISLGYIGYLSVYLCDINNAILAKFLSSIIFPVGILLCIFLGGNLCTSNVLIVSGVFFKKVKINSYLSDLLITWFFNAIGAILIASIAFGANLFKNHEIDIINLALNTKINIEWWQAILSAIICNILVVSAIFSYNACNNKAIGTFIVYLVIFLFALSGSQHIVANFFILSESGFMSINSIKAFNSEQVGMIFYNNIIPTTIGNFIGGFSIPFIYLLSSYHKKLNKNKT